MKTEARIEQRRITPPDEPMPHRHLTPVEGTTQHQRSVVEETTATGPLGALTWAHFLNDGYVNYLPAILPVLLQQLNIPLALVGSLILALQGLGSLLQPFTGWWADRLGGRRLVLTGLALSALGASLIGLAPNYWLLIALLAVTGLGNAIFHPQAMASARSVVRSRHGLMMFLFLIGGEFGRGLWPSVAGLLVVMLGLHSLWVFALPGLATLLLLGRLVPELPARSQARLQKVAPTHWLPVLALVGFVGLRASVSYGVSTFVPLLWHDRGGSLVAGASLISVMLVVGIAGNLSGGMLADWIGRRPVLLASSLFSALFLGLFMVAQGPWLWVSLALLGIASFATAPITLLIGQDLFPNNHSMGSGLALGVGNAVGAFVVFGFGFLAAAAGLQIPLWSIAGLALLGIPLALALPE